MCACHGTGVGGRGQLSTISSSFGELEHLHTHWVTSPSLWERRDPSTKEAPSPSVCGLIIRPVSFLCVSMSVCACVQVYVEARGQFQDAVPLTFFFFVTLAGGLLAE